MKNSSALVSGSRISGAHLFWVLSGFYRRLIIAGLLAASVSYAGEALTKAATLSGAPGAHSTREKLSKVLKLINIDNYIHEFEKPGSSDEGPKGVSFPSGVTVPKDPSTGLPRQTHPYEWDSLRTPEEILEHRDGGSCGSHALALAALLRTSGVPSADIRLVGTVLAQDYIEICPGAALAARQEKWQHWDPSTQRNYSTDVHPASGHVFLQIKVDGVWHLLNSTANPLAIDDAPDSPSKIFLRAQIEKCKPLPKGDEKRKCFQNARAQAAEKVRLEEYEVFPYGLIEPANLVGGSKPRLMPLQEFPSLKYLNPDRSAPLGPPLLAFNVWTMENYPKHTIEQRNNLVASGELSSKTCRWSADSVREIINAGAARPAAKKPDGQTAKPDSSLDETH